MEKQTLVVEIEATEEEVAKLLAELEQREAKGEFEIAAVTLRKK